jgi:hypothetical protein
MRYAMHPALRLITVSQEVNQNIQALKKTITFESLLRYFGPFESEADAMEFYDRAG